MQLQTSLLDYVGKSASRNLRSVHKTTLLACGLLLCGTTFSCQMPQVADSGIKVAGGEVTTEFGGTYYTRITTSVGGAPSGDIANVATLLDVGAPSHKILLVSLADSFRGAGTGANANYLPVIDELSVSLFGDAGATGSPVLSLNGLKFQRDGKLTGQIPVVFVGARLERVSGSFISRLVASQVEAVGSRVVDPSPLQVGSVDLRNIATAFVMVAIPKTMLGQLQSAQLMTSEQRPQEGELAKGQLKMVGYGDLSVTTDARTIQVNKNTLRNVATVKPLTTSAETKSPLQLLTAGVPQVAGQIWEVEGAGICGAKDSVNYDTGSAIYFRPGETGDWKFVGFVARSTSKSAGFRGIAQCDQVAPDDMASLVVSPSQSHISKIVSQF